MELKIRYENVYQVIELTEEQTDDLWVSLSLDGEGLSQAEKEQRIQEAWEKRFNRPDYNCWHRHTRHTDPTPKARRQNGTRGYIAPDEDDDFDVTGQLAVSDFRSEQEIRDDEALLRERMYMPTRVSAV